MVPTTYLLPHQVHLAALVLLHMLLPMVLLAVVRHLLLLLAQKVLLAEKGLLAETGLLAESGLLAVVRRLLLESAVALETVLDLLAVEVQKVLVGHSRTAEARDTEVELQTSFDCSTLTENIVCMTRPVQEVELLGRHFAC